MDQLGVTSTDSALLATIREGLPPIRRRAHVVVVGAGMAGLVAAYELSRVGHEVTVLEARARVGGRILTARDPFSDGLAGELGAMRLPVAHRLTQAYIRDFGLTTAPFRSNNPAAWSYVHGQRRRSSEPLDDTFDLASDERGLGLDALLERTLGPLRAMATTPEGWARIEASWGKSSLRDFLDASGWSAGAVEMFGVLARHESLMDTSFLEFFRGSNHGASEMVRIVGGMDQLPRAFLRRIGRHLRYGAVVRRIEQGPGYARAHYDSAGLQHSVTGDYLIVALPYSVLRHIETIPAWSPAKQRAIRQVHYDNAAKIIFQFRRRFWEDEGIRYGSSVTDLPIRTVVYAEPDSDSPRGLLTASYTWGQDAQRWALLGEQERISQALQNLRLLHARAPDEFELGISHVWQNDPFAGGAYTLFQPGQQNRIHADVIQAEGRVHFAGEHTSLMHRWVEGAVESGLRVAVAVSAAAQRREPLAPLVAAPIATGASEPHRPELLARALEAVRSADAIGLRACLLSAPDLVGRLLAEERGADSPLAGATLLHPAVRAACATGGDALRIVEVLLDAGADPSARCLVDAGANRGTLARSPLALAVSATRGEVDDAIAVVTLLEEHGAQPDEDEALPLLLALGATRAARPTAKLCHVLRRGGAEPDLAMAAGLGDLELVAARLSGPGCEPAQRARLESDRLDPRDREWLLTEALAFAARAGHLRLTDLLLAHGANPMRTVSIDGVRQTAVHAAARTDEVEVVERLLLAGADPLVADSEWSASAFGWAVNAGATRVVAALWARGGLPPEDVVYLGSPAQVREALGGRSPDHAHLNGAPGVLLRNAAHAGRDEICALLVSLGADRSLRSPLGARPSDVAARAGHLLLARKLEPGR